MTHSELFDSAEQMERNGQFAEAFAAYARVAADEQMATAKQRAWAWLCMGQLCKPFPGVALGGSDSGLIYYQKAIEIDEDCVDAWLSILNEFEETGPYHRDLEWFKKAADHLLSRGAQLPVAYRNIVDVQIRKYGRLIGLP